MALQPQHKRRSFDAWVESLYPVVVPLLITGFAAYLIHTFRYHPASNEPISNILSASIDFSAITVGLLVTALTILVGMENKPVVRVLRNKRRDNIYDYCLQAISSFFVLAILSILGFLVDFETPQSWHYWVSLFWIFMFTLSLVFYYRAISIVIRIVKVPD